MNFKDFLNSSSITNLLEKALISLASIIATFFTTNHMDKKNKINELIKENKSLKEIIQKHENLNEKEKKIDKSNGSIYVMETNFFEKRYICGYCWEESNKTIPIVPEFTEDYVYNYGVECKKCKIDCFFIHQEEEKEVPF